MNNGNGLVVLAVPARMTFEDWTARVKNVAMMKKKLPFYIGDLVLYGEQTFGEKASQMLNDFGYTNEQLSNFRWVSKKFPPEERCDLPWSWHQSAAKLPKRERDKALSAALAGEMNRADIRALAAGVGVGHGNGTAMAPSRVSASTEGIAEALVAFSKLLRRYRDGEKVDDLLKDAGDTLFEQWQILAEKLA